jgi:hypothetical protein
MTEIGPGAVEPLIGRRSKAAVVTTGALALLAGCVAVFTTDNELGSTALVAAGVGLTALALVGNRLKAVEAAGVRLELERQALEARVEAREARATGDVDRAEKLEQRADYLLAAAGDVGRRYEHLRNTEPSSWTRTSRMEDVLRDARALDAKSLTPEDVERIFATGTDGNRVVAIALIEEAPRLAVPTALVDAIVHSRSAFEQYHALSAAERALDSLLADDRAKVLEAVKLVLDGRLGETASDRGRVARRILERSRR